MWPGVDTDGAVCLKHAICVPVCALIPGSCALTVSHLKRVITAGNPSLEVGLGVVGRLLALWFWLRLASCFSKPRHLRRPLWLGFLRRLPGSLVWRVQEHPTGGLVL